MICMLHSCSAKNTSQRSISPSLHCFLNGRKEERGKLQRKKEKRRRNKREREKRRKKEKGKERKESGKAERNEMKR